MNLEKPTRLDVFMYALMKEARQFDFSEFLENWDITEEEYNSISDWFKRELDIRL